MSTLAVTYFKGVGQGVTRHQSPTSFSEYRVHVMHLKKGAFELPGHAHHFETPDHYCSDTLASSHN